MTWYHVTSRHGPKVSENCHKWCIFSDQYSTWAIWKWSSAAPACIKFVTCFKPASFDDTNTTFWDTSIRICGLVVKSNLNLVGKAGLNPREVETLYSILTISLVTEPVSGLTRAFILLHSLYFSLSQNLPVVISRWQSFKYWYENLTSSLLEHLQTLQSGLGPGLAQMCYHLLAWHLGRDYSHCIASVLFLSKELRKFCNAHPPDWWIASKWTAFSTQDTGTKARVALMSCLIFAEFNWNMVRTEENCNTWATVSHS